MPIRMPLLLLECSKYHKPSMLNLEIDVYCPSNIAKHQDFDGIETPSFAHPSKHPIVTFQLVEHFDSHIQYTPISFSNYNK